MNAESPRVNQKEFAAIAGRLMACPAAPFHEAGVRDVVEEICAEHDLPCKRDAFGNVLSELTQTAGVPGVSSATHIYQNNATDWIL